MRHDSATSVVEFSNGGEVEKRTILRGEPFILAELLDQHQCIAEAAREYEFCEFPPLDAGLYKVDKAENIVFELMLPQQPFDVAQLGD